MSPKATNRDQHEEYEEYEEYVRGSRTTEPVAGSDRNRGGHLVTGATGRRGEHLPFRETAGRWTLDAGRWTLEVP
ncbi:hypothetical protein [Streptomyces sp. NBC_01314]|uniref:hypothetical protein n=1 Tax=Streptomyces sp. NBC_01314 TaxID=2903821 RepID=UPI00308DFFD7|nr:hypothetical protein OG622_21820 [Streptomyces sp. NBC_01314]